LGRPIKHQIRAVVGGSLGGNMGLRLAQRSTTRFPWLNTIAAWSPASTWGASWARARLLPMGDGTYMDVGKHEAVRVSRDRTNERESDESRYNYFYQVFGHYQVLEGDQSDRWYRKCWEPCKTQYRQGARFDREEIYSAIYRQWHWRVAHEQLVFMHWEANEPSGHARFKNIQSRLLLGAGDQDNTPPDKLWDNTRELAINMINTQGSTTWMCATGHSIHNERPAMLAASWSSSWPCQNRRREAPCAGRAGFPRAAPRCCQAASAFLQTKMADWNLRLSMLPVAASAPAARPPSTACRSALGVK
jgi:pimeloyl-ACP methyl ester carboxylesterase